jgi:hypothetical protein
MASGITMLGMKRHAHWFLLVYSIADLRIDPFGRPARAPICSTPRCNAGQYPRAKIGARCRLPPLRVVDHQALDQIHYVRRGSWP